MRNHKAINTHKMPRKTLFPVQKSFLFRVIARLTRTHLCAVPS